MGSKSSDQEIQINNNSTSTIMDIRKRKRMVSNRESARRSRQRKQVHLDDLTAQVSQLNNQNGQILSTINATTQHYLNLEAENSVLRAQMAELSHRLHSLNEIIHCLSSNTATATTTTTVSTTTAVSESDDLESFGGFEFDFDLDDGLPMALPFASHPVMPTALGLDAFMC